MDEGGELCYGERFVKNLNKLAEDQIPPLNDRIHLHSYYQTLESMYLQAQTYLREGDRERGYIFLQRYCLVFVKIITKHKGYYSGETSSQKRHHSKQCNHCLTYLEKLKPLLVGKHNKLHDEKLQREQEEKERQEEADKTALAAQIPPDSQETKPDASAPSASGAPSWDILRRPSAPQLPESDSNYSDKSLGGFREIVIPQNLVEDFLKAAMLNTANDIETCGILTGTLENNKFFLSTVIVPPQSGTANTCVTSGEEKLIEIQMKYDLVTLGWIHTHPSQTCFLSSIDLHTQYSYQAMLPEAIAIVCAPQKQPDVGFFSISDTGMVEVQNCDIRGFHEHKNGDTYGEAPHITHDFGASRAQIMDLR